MIGGHTASITYLRLSVTDRCDLRCAYCMPERMQFLPRSEVLSLGELDALASVSSSSRLSTSDRGRNSIRSGIQ